MASLPKALPKERLEKLRQLKVDTSVRGTDEERAKQQLQTLEDWRPITRKSLQVYSCANLRPGKAISRRAFSSCLSAVALKHGIALQAFHRPAVKELPVLWLKLFVGGALLLLAFVDGFEIVLPGAWRDAGDFTSSLSSSSHHSV